MVKTDIRKSLRLARMMQQAGNTVIYAKLKSALRSRIRRILPENVRRAYLERRQARADSRSLIAGNTFFWAHSHDHPWDQVEARILSLAAASEPEALADFVRQTFRRYSAAASMTLSLMARSGLTRDLLREELRRADVSEEGPLYARVRQSTAFAADLMSAVLFLLPEAEIRGFQRLVRQISPRSLPLYEKMLAAQAIVPSDAPVPYLATVDLSPSRQCAKHRLIIADSLASPARLSLLFEGAQKVTVISPDNLYGKAEDFDLARLHARPDEIIIAHARSRITRFSKIYHQRHDETWRAAEEIVDAMEELTGGVLGAARPHVALHLADALFFPALQYAAVEDYLQAREFDQVVIALQGHGESAAFLSYFAGLPGLADDPRVEFVSLQSEPGLRASFRDAVEAMLAGEVIAEKDHPMPRLRRSMSAARLVEDLADEISDQAQKMRRFEPGDDPEKRRILYISTSVGAYNRSSAAYLQMLSRHYTVLTGFVGSDVRGFFDGVSAEDMPVANRLQLLKPPALKHETLSQICQAVLEQTRRKLLSEGRSPYVLRLLDRDARLLEENSLLASYRYWLMIRSWIGQMVSEGRPPEAVVISPFRPAHAGIFAAVAREFSIPSMALEPHGLNGAYCRYARIPTDRYGVISGYFRRVAAEDFSIASDRVDVIGAPRLALDPERDPVRAQQAARVALMEKNPDLGFEAGRVTVCFFSQPSNQEQISAVWRDVTAACRALPGVTLLLKLHPEEGVARAAVFQAIAEEAGLTDRLELIQGTAVEAIEASDLILTCYSATAVEAAIMGKPVFCLASGAENYPLGQHEVIGGPLYRSAAELQQALEAFIRDPAPARAAAARFLEEEPQFRTGPEGPLIAAVERLITAPEPLRAQADLPERLVLEGPFEVFRV